MKRPAGGSGAKETKGVLKELDKALRAYAPKRHAKLRGAKSVGRLAKMVDVPPSLEALWAWANGADDIIVTVPDEIGRGDELYGVDRAAGELATLRKVADFPDGLVPFSGDGAGNFLAVDVKGRVVDWDHETHDVRVVAPSVAGLLKRTLAAMKKNNLFGGPEKKPGKVDPKVTRIDKLLADPLKNHADIVELSYKIDPADRYRVRTALKDAVLANNPDPERRAAALDLASEGAADAGRWDEAIRLLEEADRVEGPKSYKWAAIGRAALAAGAFDASIRAFAKVSASGFIAEARAGAVVAQSRLGKVKRADIQRAERSVASEIDELEKSIAKDVAAEGKPGITDINELAGVLGLRAALEHVAGKKEKARETLRQARKRCGIYFDMREVALAAGLRASDAK